MKISLPIIAILLFIISACNAQNVGSKPSGMKTSKMENKHTLELKKGELFLVAIADQKNGKEKLLQEYFGTIMPSAMKNGFTPLGQLHIDNIAKADNFTPNNFIGLFKWPKMESIQAFMADFSPEQLKELRIPIWNEFKAHMTALQEDMKIVVNENKTYEVRTVWSKNMVSPNSFSENGGRVILNQPIVGYEDLLGNDAPNYILIIEWNDKKSAESFKEMNMVKSQKEEIFYTHFTLFP